MSSCRDIELLITASVDEAATADERAAVDAHLRQCAGCRQRAARETAVRRMLGERADVLHVSAPAGLRAKCQPPPRRAAWFGRHLGALRPLPAWATVAVIALVFVSVFALVNRGSTALAAELALDHVKCFTLFERASGPGDAAVIAGRMKAAYGWDVAVPASSRALHLQLVGGRRCFSTDGRVAHILYRHAGRPLSLFIVPSTSRGAEQVAVMGHEAVIWSRGGSTYVVLARERRDDLARVAAYVRSVIR
jgi:anti-sigma factor RsiW